MPLTPLQIEEILRADHDHDCPGYGRDKICVRIVARNPTFSPDKTASHASLLGRRSLDKSHATRAVQTRQQRLALPVAAPLATPCISPILRSRAQRSQKPQGKNNSLGLIHDRLSSPSIRFQLLHAPHASCIRSMISG